MVRGIKGDLSNIFIIFKITGLEKTLWVRLAANRGLDKYPRVKDEEYGRDIGSRRARAE